MSLVQDRMEVPDPVTRQVLDVADAVGDFIGYWGFPAVQGRVWTVLALRQGPMTQAEIARVLGVSRALVSGAVGDLRRLGLIRRTHNHRNAPYEAIMDVWPTISGVLRKREWLLLESARTALEGAIDEARIAGANQQSVLYDVRRMQLLLSMTEAAQGFIQGLMSLRLPRSIEGVGRWVRTSARLIRALRESPGLGGAS